MKKAKIFFMMLIPVLAACKARQSQVSDDSETKALVSMCGKSKIYVWNRRILSKEDGIWRSCWYHIEAKPRSGFDDRAALLNSKKLTNYAILDAYLQETLWSMYRDEWARIGVEFVPCGLAGASTVASVLSIYGTGGTWTVPFIIGAATAGNTCIKNAYLIKGHFDAKSGAKDAVVSLQNGETSMTKKYPATKHETDAFIESIKRAIQLGMESPQICPSPDAFKNEILNNGIINSGDEW